MSDFIIRYIVNSALCLLAALSALTWMLILYKAYANWQLAAQDRHFTGSFPQAAGRGLLTAIAAQQPLATGPKARVAHAGFSALSSVEATEVGGLSRSPARDPHRLLESALTRQIRRERRALESGLTLLASIANVAPFVGLFGTVFGIIHALHTMTGSDHGSIGSVAVPVGQALVATGVGIAVAIPAVLAYNLLLRRLNVSLADLEEYAADFVNLAECAGFAIGQTDHSVGGEVLPLARTQEARA
ncbi:MotA/TolQ/ExbB proton channel family protein [Paraburkholderia elongata]|uniref:MotA/TolQ/ExbB proton channel family protein n=1 Tax=Paraburkholderia elongata TaxID=2675747 RepID=A0A972NLX5_9BURK|nr:MotA/TolQ/ExbB proton channel family protein [Paraburkholderia elongata]NPT54694.1 MotA/TolQ/ExbB proton channel family protein [Paraburkholderia elongata]